MRLDDLLECAARIEGLRHSSRRSISEGEIVFWDFVWLRIFCSGYVVDWVYMRLFGVGIAG